MKGTIRVGLLFALTALLSGCSWISISHCTYWNLMPAFGIDYNPSICQGGQPTVTKKPQEIRP